MGSVGGRTEHSSGNCPEIPCVSQQLGSISLPSSQSKTKTVGLHIKRMWKQANSDNLYMITRKLNSGLAKTNPHLHAQEAQKLNFKAQNRSQ